jgi:hypothetical protein
LVGFLLAGSPTAITAAGTTQATATEITTAINNVTVVAAARKWGKTSNSPARGANLDAKLRCFRRSKHLSLPLEPRSTLLGLTLLSRLQQA